jgi:hypothetical protein
MASKSTVFPIFLLGLVCFAATAVLVVMFATTGGFHGSAGDDVVLGVPLLCGIAAFRAGFEELARQRAGTAKPARKRRRSAPVETTSAPRLGDDPFRDPPRAPPIVVERERSAPVAVPIVPGDPADRPKLLT